MPHHGKHSPSKKLLVIMPTWLGDCVMATPTLRALRGLYPEAHITVLVRKSLRPILDGLPSVDRIIAVRSGKAGDGVKPQGKTKKRRSLIGLGRRLSRGDFDSAVLLPNSFKSAAIASMAGIPRRVGYDRDGRGVLLTDRLIPRRHKGKFLPVSTLDYYMGLARYLGARDTDHRMELATRSDVDRLADDRLRQAGFDPVADELLLLNPGAQKEMKRWPAERFGAFADEMAQRHGLTPAVTGSPAERDILDRVIASASVPVIDLPAMGMDLHLMKSFVRRSRMMVTNDTGPRHVAAAFGIPVVTLFGPTTPAWTQIGFDKELQVIAGGEPGADQPEVPAPMTDITVEHLVAAASRFYGQTQNCAAGPLS